MMKRTFYDHYIEICAMRGVTPHLPAPSTKRIKTPDASPDYKREYARSLAKQTRNASNALDITSDNSAARAIAASEAWAKRMGL